MNELGHRLEIGRTLSATMETLGRQPLKFGGMALASAVLLALADTYLGRAGTSAGNIAIFVVSVMATLFGLQLRCGPDVVMKPNIRRALGASILSGLAMLIGFVLLIVPGVMLFARWALILPVIVREDLGVQAAMGRSAELTKGGRWHMIGLALIIWVPTILMGVLVSILFAAFAGEEALDTVLFNLPLNLLIAAATVLSAVLFVEAYLTLSGERDQPVALAEIFA
jgi:uncharacterized membrane protein